MALYMRLIGWQVRLSKNSRGPADIVAEIDCKEAQKKWLIQVKSSRSIPRIKGQEILRLIAAASDARGDPIVAALRPHIGVEAEQVIHLCGDHNPESKLGFGSIRFAVTFFYLPSWNMIRPEILTPNQMTN